VKYYQTFASHYISFFERNENMVKELLSFDQIRQYGVDHSIEILVKDIAIVDSVVPGGGKYSRSYFNIGIWSIGITY